MKLPQISKRQVSAGLLAIAALMLVDSIYQIGMHVRWRYWIPATLAIEVPSTQPAASQPATQAASQPAGTQPASQPAARQAAGSQSAGTQPAASQPATQATGSRPNATQAAASQPTATQPAARGPDGQKPGGPGAPPGGPPATKPAKPHELAAAIKKRNIMAEPKPPGHGLTLAGVLDNVAFFRSREGQDVAIEEGKSGPNGVKVTKIDGTNVTVEYEGKPETLKLFADSPGSGPAAPGRAEPPDRGAAAKPEMTAAAPAESGRAASGASSQSGGSPAVNKTMMQPAAASSQQASTR